MTAPRTTGVDGAPLAIRMQGIVKTFGGVVANRGASLEVKRGEIHALVGENGAGKSTLMRILSGMYHPDAGRVEIGDASGQLRDVTGWSTAEAIDAGVGMVHQHFMLVPPLTVAENVVLGREPKQGVQLDHRSAERAVNELAMRSGLAVPATSRVADLSVGEAQRVEILKAIYRGARILVLDEPTAVLSPPEVRQLWEVLRKLRADGGTIVLITHKLDEVMDVSDAITVMRAGETVARLRTSETSPRDIARAMVGRDVALALDAARGPAPAATALPNGPALLELRNVRVDGTRRAAVVDDVSFTVAAGEILGIAGVEGNGQTELVEALAGLRAATGSVVLAGRDIGGASVRERGDAGLSHIPEDRHDRGLILDYSVAENLILGQQHRFTRGLTLDAARIGDQARALIARYDIRPADPDLPARALSGGNQQKIVVAREMGRDFRVLLAAQPTRGVDVGAIEFIHARLREARDQGKAVLLVSADLAEVLALADRVAVMYGGRFVAVLPRAEATPDVIGPLMTGAERAA
ncbi:MAG TPA: ABC transporter ATP-binding protein [Gemmatimonadaceae bacterium]|nr:ABC transporter ATP-binding protein [Gemmatimonadaceae bacterium]